MRLAILATITGLLTGAALVMMQGQTRIDLDKQAKGTANFDFTTYRAIEPMAPGSCTAKGSGAWAVDTAGYFYICTNVPRTSLNQVWLRSAVPMSQAW